ncbi:hypothetical protein ABTX82_39220 [Streptomyces lavendulae]|uniref:hypothetical protein n=1 Tax=Streptomyces lavendulae TaxID=1914 RepID=UPI00332221E8
MATGTGAWYTFGGDRRGGPGVLADSAAAASLAGSPDLPWPAEGQASAEVDGMGSLGTKGEQIPVPIASITKLMTAYVILTGHPLSGDGHGEEATADQQAADESFSTAESTAPVAAGWDSGDEERFTEKMNKAAAALGMDALPTPEPPASRPTRRARPPTR